MSGPLAAACAAIALWYTSGLCFAAGGRLMGPMVFTSLSCAVGSAAGMALHRMRGGRARDLVAMPGRVWVAGALGVAVYTVLLALAIGLAPDADVGQVALINNLWPILIVVAARFLLRERSHAGLTAAGAALGLAGVALARGPHAILRSPESLLPHALAFAAAWLWALYSVLIRRWRVPEEQNGSTVHFALCALLAGAVGAARGEWGRMAPMGGAGLGWVIGFGIGPVGIAYYLWEIGAKRGPTGLIAALSFTIPVVSSILIGLTFRQALNPYLAPAAALIALGAWLAARARERSPTGGAPA